MPVLPSTLAIILIGGVLLYRRLDVRLVLLLAAAALFVLRATQRDMAGQRANVVAGLFVEFAREMTDARFVVPICSAMGFAYVCKQTGCDAHLVHLLCRPLRRVRWLLVPGGVAVAFFVNSAIVSQTSTVSVVGPVLVPLVLAAGFSRETAGAMLLLGGSMGGELLNPASVEVGATARAVRPVAAALGASPIEALSIVGIILPYALVACGTALLAFWLLTIWRDRPGTASLPESLLQGGPASDAADPSLSAQASMIGSAMASDAPEVVTRVNLAKAVVPLVPILILLLVHRHVIPLPKVLQPGAANGIAEQATIGAAMLIGANVAAIVSFRRSGRVAAAFCDGAGFAYGQVIFVIIAATLFARGIEMNGLIDRLTTSLGHAPAVMAMAGVAVPWIMATVAGTAVGTAPSIIALIIPAAVTSAPPAHELAAALNVGAISSVASQFGRTCSPVAPVVLMCAAISHARVPELLRRVIPALLFGGVVLLVLGLLRR